MGCASTCTGYVLRNDIDLALSRWSSSSTNGWAPIGGESAPYKTRFDGVGHVIRNLFIDRGNEENVGLFGRIAADGRIEGLGLIDADVTGSREVGTLVGHNTGEIIDSHAVATVVGDFNVGGLAGYNAGKIIGSYAVATITGSLYVGGLAGWNVGAIRAGYAVATVNGSDFIGGLAGNNESSGGEIAASYAAAIVIGSESKVGGLAGASFGTIKASYAVSAAGGGNLNIGGLVGSSNVSAGGQLLGHRRLRLV